MREKFLALWLQLCPHYTLMCLFTGSSECPLTRPFSGDEAATYMLSVARSQSPLSQQRPCYEEKWRMTESRSFWMDGWLNSSQQPLCESARASVLLLKVQVHHSSHQSLFLHFDLRRETWIQICEITVFLSLQNIFLHPKHWSWSSLGFPTEISSRVKQRVINYTNKPRPN